MKTKNILKKLYFWIPFLTLLTISLFVMYHAKFIMNTYEHHFERQLLWFGIGIFLLFIFQYIPTKKLFSYSFLFYIINLFFLVLVLFIGKDINGARAWIDFKYFSFQPSELMKLSLSLFLANFCTRKKPKNWKEEIVFLLKVFIICLIPSLLVFLEPDTGAIIFYLLITLTLLCGTIRKRWIILIIGTILSLLSIFFYFYFQNKDLLINLIGTSFFYRMDRILTLGSGMQIENALIALGSAPIINFSLTKTGIYIPEAPTDFVFALIANVFGITGNIIVLISFFLIDCYLINYQKKEKNKTLKLFDKAFLSILIPSEIIGIAMNLGLFPIIGIPLPFLSYGGSSTIVLFLFLAILFSKTNKKKAKKKM